MSHQLVSPSPPGAWAGYKREPDAGPPHYQRQPARSERNQPPTSASTSLSAHQPAFPPVHVKTDIPGTEGTITILRASSDPRNGNYYSARMVSFNPLQHLGRYQTFLKCLYTPFSTRTSVYWMAEWLERLLMGYCNSALMDLQSPYAKSLTPLVLHELLAALCSSHIL